MRVPGTRVVIGRNSPRRADGAFGLRSKVSSCDGPPHMYRRMQFFARGTPASRRALATARPCTSEASPMPAKPRPPTVKNCRRVSAPMHRPGFETWIMGAPSVGRPLRSLHLLGLGHSDGEITGGLRSLGEIE